LLQTQQREFPLFRIGIEGERRMMGEKLSFSRWLTAMASSMVFMKGSGTLSAGCMAGPDWNQSRYRSSTAILDFFRNPMSSALEFGFRLPGKVTSQSCLMLSNVQCDVTACLR
jgi:hypothetical protein